MNPPDNSFCFAPMFNHPPHTDKAGVVHASYDATGAFHPYMAAYEKLLTRCSTDHAPWYVVPADRKWYRNLTVAGALVEAIKGLGPRFPEPQLSPGRLRRLRF